MFWLYFIIKHMYHLVSQFRGMLDVYQICFIGWNFSLDIPFAVCKASRPLSIIKSLLAIQTFTANQTD